MIVRPEQLGCVFLLSHQQEIGHTWGNIGYKYRGLVVHFRMIMKTVSRMVIDGCNSGLSLRDWHRSVECMDHLSSDLSLGGWIVIFPFT